MKNVIIVGYGEIGSSLGECYFDVKDKFAVHIIDKKFDEPPPLIEGGCQIMNICLPFINFDQFSQAVCSYTKDYAPECLIIHSTVPPETTKALSEKLGPEIIEIVHSPVRGVHPDLYAGLKTFVKFIGPARGSGLITHKHFDDLGIKNTFFKSSTATELAKVLSTTYYGLCIAFHHDMHVLCKKFDVEFEEVATRWNKTYNDGYSKLGMNNVVRPVLYPPSNGKIGGHCVVPNAELSKKYFDSMALDYILSLK